MRVEVWADGVLVDVADDGLPSLDEQPDPADPVVVLQAQVAELRAALEALLGVGSGKDV